LVEKKRELIDLVKKHAMLFGIDRIKEKAPKIED
jgi:hypothetical protein